MEKIFWDRAKSGEDIFLYIIQNSNGMRVEISNFGAIIWGLYVPDKNGKIENVVMGYDKFADYYKNWHGIGCTVGPNANRIADAKFILDGKEYCLEAGPDGHNLHSNFTLGYQKRVWSVDRYAENEITFSIECKDGEMGFPGNKFNRVTFTVTEENELKIHYYVTTDKKTIVNMTNHSYFNLSGDLTTSIKNHTLWLDCPHYTPVDDHGIPTGEMKSVTDTVMDFTVPKKIGIGLKSGDKELKKANGYDHNFCIRDWDKSLKVIGRLYEEKSGRCMEVFTDLPGIQIYTGNYLGVCFGRDKKIYKTHGAICMETQYFPNHINEENFVSAIFDEEHPYDSTTIYKFSIK